jgi:thymidine kinase
MSIYNGNDYGSITVIWGSMYSGKTEELIRRLKRAIFANQQYQLFKPLKDDRYSKDEVKTHYGQGLHATVVKNSFELLNSIDPKAKIIGIDEGQFFDEDLIFVCKKLKTEQHMDIIISGLDMNCFGTPYKIMSELAAISNNCVKLNAVCVDCGKDAYISHILVDDTSGELVGGSDTYVALCEKHYSVRNINKMG